MALTGLLSLLRAEPRYQSTLAAVLEGRAAELPDQRVLRAARPYVIAALARELNRPLIVITASVERAHAIAEQLPVWTPDIPIQRYSDPGALFYERAPWASNAIRARIGALAALCPPVGVNLDVIAGCPPIIVTSALALMQRTLPPRDFRLGSRLLKCGQQNDPDKLMRAWLGVGYLPATIVTEPGTFSRRGGIVDIFPVAALRPARIEFFGDEIDSLRAFDPATQRSAEILNQLIVTPAREALPKYGTQAADALQTWFNARHSTTAEDLADTPIVDDENDLRSESAFPALEFYLPYLYGEATAGLLDYAPAEALIVLDDRAAFAEAVEMLEAQAIEQHAERLNAGQLPPDYPLPYLTWDDLQDALADRPTLSLGGSALSDSPDDVESERTGTLGDLFAPGAHYGGQLRTFLETMRISARRGERTIVVTRQALRLAELWQADSRNSSSSPRTDLPDLPAPGEIVFLESALAEGWAFRSENLSESPTAVLTDAELFGWRRPEPRRHPVPRAKSPEMLFNDLSVGDFVVHSEYGVGRLAGLHRRVIEGTEREYFVIEFAGSDTLYVPIHQVDRLTRYVGPTEAPPKMHRLGSADWQKDKEAARVAAEQVARELLELYAMRAHVRGHAFSPDTPWQREVEAAFPYIETDDQLRALQEVKADMERPQPMDRLICGDVGFGKTEVALRAAFKAVMDGKQVAVLVPTTVLAQQHYNTFRERLTPFPVKVEMLSRFRTRQEQHVILDDLAKGKIDILVGTHRLLQTDVTFKDLGLLIVDEEQRFGVTHKEKLKRLRTDVDVLALTATPIPRTLYMSLTGVRDISIIQTPPEERLPVLTHVGAYEEGLVRQAILREIDRGGQVFYVHNRVSTIEAIGRRLRLLVPEARIGIGHGQMHEDELEEIMASFARGDFDMLLCTTIIESGLDIPNANTIILDRADQFGLAQLYQLRGRVGRSAARAYAYFLHPRHSRMTDDARARLETIAEQTELGAGLSIAMRDLEIRGAGDLLGTRQSGYIASVGFHLYTQLLSQAVTQLKAGQPVAPPINSAAPVIIELPVTAYVPTAFIADMSLRMQLYRRLADVREESDIDSLRAELLDRFGTLPAELDGLLFQLRVKLLAYRAHVNAITANADQISIRLPYLAEIDRAALQRFLGNGARVSRTAVWLTRADESDEWQSRLLRVLERLAVNSPEAAA